MTFIGVDGCPDGWLAVEYRGDEFASVASFEEVDALWNEYSDAESILIDIPIGLRKDSNEPRPCDHAARKRLGSPRSSSVFPTPIRGALEADSYKEARRIQEETTGGSLGAQTWGISEKIEQLDDFMCDQKSEKSSRVREAHPEVCYWALNGRTATQYSKTGQPVAAFWERVEILEQVDEEIITDLRAAGNDLDAGATNDDLLDAFVLAVTASPLTGEPETLPEQEPDEDPGDLTGLPMEMVYSQPTS